MRFVIKNDDERLQLSMRTAHEKYNLDAINIRLYNRGEKLWNKLQRTEPDLVENSEMLNDGGIPDHKWWRRIASDVGGAPPDPIYTS